MATATYANPVTIKTRVKHLSDLQDVISYDGCAAIFDDLIKTSLDLDIQRSRDPDRPGVGE